MHLNRNNFYRFNKYLVFIVPGVLLIGSTGCTGYEKSSLRNKSNDVHLYSLDIERENELEELLEHTDNNN